MKTDDDLLTKLIHSEYYNIRTSEITADKVMSIPGLIRLIMESAMLHAIELKVSVWDLENQQLAWVIRRFKLSINTLPKLGDQIQISTNPSGNDRLFTYRDFTIKDSRGVILATASSSWIMINLAKRKLVALPQYIQDILIPTNQFKHHPRPSGKWPLGTTLTKSKHFMVQYHQLDFNGHMSNLYYPEWILEPFGAKWMETHKIKSMDIVYKNECHYSDKINAQLFQLDNHHFTHQLVKSDGLEVLVAQTIWTTQ